MLDVSSAAMLVFLAATARTWIISRCMFLGHQRKNQIEGIAPLSFMLAIELAAVSLSNCRTPKLSGHGNRNDLTPWQTITGCRGPLRRLVRDPSSQAGPRSQSLFRTAKREFSCLTSERLGRQKCHRK